MSAIFAAAAVIGLLAQTPAAELERERHDDTIYIVHGTRDQLARFDTDIAARWMGGKLLAKDNDQGAYSYWAFPDRTAPQAREFMFGAMSAGLALDILEYDERKSFPAERSTLDEIAISCGFRHDPFFVTPVGELKVTFSAVDGEQLANCVTRKLKTARLPKIKKRSVN